MKIIISSTLFLLVIVCQAQVVDKTRLEYFEDKLVSPQIGMTISSDGQMGAFLFANSKLNVFDLIHSRLLKTLPIEIGDVGEIRFNSDNSELVIIERNRVRALDWRTGEIKMDEALSDEIVCGDISLNNMLAVASLDNITVWDLNSHSKKNTISVKQNIATIFFSPKEAHLMVNPRVNMLGSKSFIYDYNTGQIVNTFNKLFFGTYDATGDRMFIHRFRRVKVKRSTVSTPVLYESSVNNLKDSRVIYSGLEKSSDVGTVTTTLPIADKLVGTAGYRGFTVYDVVNGGKVFTTKKTKRDRSASAFGFYQKYVAKVVYKLNEDRVLINAYGDNINQIYSASQNEIIGYIFTDGNNDLATITRDGKFDGSIQAASKLYWSAKNSSKKTSVESTFDRGFTPNLLVSLINTQNVIVDFDIDAEIGAIPEIRIKSFNQEQVSEKGTSPIFSSSQKLATIEVEIESDIKTVKQIKLFQNNKVVGAEDDPASTIISFEVSLTSTFGVDNFFYATASGKNGIDSEKQKITVKYTGKTDDKAKLFLVTIGINEYKNPKYNLNYAIADADAFENAMSEGAKPVFETIQNVKIRNNDFNKKNILTALETVQRESSEQDMLIFYYAGHGVMSEGAAKDSDFFLVPHDVTQLYGRDDLLYEKAISATELKDISRKINAQKQVFILDACQSAAALDAVTRRGVAEERAIAQLARSTGTFWITATGSEQYATEFESLGHGVFTYALVEGLNGKADGGNQDNKITVRELNAYLESRVPELAEEYKGSPQFPSGYSFGNDFPLVIYKN